MASCNGGSCNGAVVAPMARNNNAAGGVGLYSSILLSTSSTVEKIFNYDADDQEHAVTTHRVSVAKVSKSALAEHYTTPLFSLTQEMCLEASYSLELEIPRVGDLVSTMFLKIYYPGIMNVIENHEGVPISFMGGYLDSEVITLEPGQACEVCPDFETLYKVKFYGQLAGNRNNEKTNIIADPSLTGAESMRANNAVDSFGVCAAFYAPVYAMFENIETSFGRGVVETYDADTLFLLYEFASDLFTNSHTIDKETLMFDTTTTDQKHVTDAYFATRCGRERFMAFPSVLNFQHERTHDGNHLRHGWWHCSTSFHNMKVTLTLKSIESYVMNFASPESAGGASQQSMPVRLAPNGVGVDGAEAPAGVDQEDIVSLPLRTVVVPGEWPKYKSSAYIPQSQQGGWHTLRPSDCDGKSLRSLRWYFFGFAMDVEMEVMAESEAALYCDRNTELAWINMNNIRFRACPQSAAPASLQCCEEPDIEVESDTLLFDFLITNYRTYKSLVLMIRTDSQLISSPRRGEKPSEAQEEKYGPVWYKNRVRTAYSSGYGGYEPVKMMTAMSLYANDATAHYVPTSQNGMHPPKFWSHLSSTTGLDSGDLEVYNIHGRWNGGKNLVNTFGNAPLNVARIDRMGCKLEIKKYMFEDNEGADRWISSNLKNNKITVCFIATANNVLRMLYGLSGLAIATGAGDKA